MTALLARPETQAHPDSPARRPWAAIPPVEQVPTTGAAEERLTVLDGGSYRIVLRGDGVLGLAIPQPRAELWDVYCTTPDRCGLVSEAPPVSFPARTEPPGPNRHPGSAGSGRCGTPAAFRERLQQAAERLQRFVHACLRRERCRT